MILSKNKRFKIVGKCSDSTETEDMCRILKPNILLLDINMTPLNGIEVAKRVRQISPMTRIIAVTVSNHPAHAKKMFSLGACGYITKNSPAIEMTKGILTVFSGKKYICTEMKELLSLTSGIADGGLAALSKGTNERAAPHPACTGAWRFSARARPDARHACGSGHARRACDAGRRGRRRPSGREGRLQPGPRRFR